MLGMLHEVDDLVEVGVNQHLSSFTIFICCTADELDGPDHVVDFGREIAPNDIGNLLLLNKSALQGR